MRDLLEADGFGEASTATPRRKPQGLRLEVVLSSQCGSQPAVLDNVRATGAGVRGAIGLVVNQPVTLELINGRCIAATVVSGAPGQSAIEFIHPIHGHDPLLRLAGKRDEPEGVRHLV